MGGGHDHIARLLVAARDENRLLESYPGTMPTTLADAYAIQELAIELAGDTVGGWKVGGIGPDHAERHGASRLAGPIHAQRIFEAGGTSVTMPVLAGFAAAETEIMVRMGSLPDHFDDPEDLFDHVAEMRFGLEVASSPFTGINEHGPAVTVSDFGNNYGLVLGPRIDDWRNAALPEVTTTIDGEVAGRAPFPVIVDGPLAAVAFLVRNLRARGRELGPKDWVSSGAITGVHQVSAPVDVIARCGTMRLNCKLVVQPPAD